MDKKKHNREEEEKIFEEEPNEHGPIYNPVNRFAHLPKPTREWLESLDKEDIDEIKEAIKFYHATRTIGRFWKWLIITVVSVFVGAAQFGEAIVKAFSWLFGRGGH